MGIFGFIGVFSLAFITFGRCRTKPNVADMPTREPLIDNSNASGASGYIGLNPVKLKEIRAHGKFGSVWQVCLSFFLLILTLCDRTQRESLPPDYVALLTSLNTS